MAVNGLFPDQPKVGTGPAENTAHRTVIWWWNTKWMTVAERGFIDVEIPSFQIDRVLVAVGLVESRGAAQRLIKQKGVSWRRDDSTVSQDADGKWWATPIEWSQVTDWKQEIEAGWPVVLRVGNGHWRTVQIEVEDPVTKKPTTKPKSMNSLALVMRPVENQTKEVWTELWD